MGDGAGGHGAGIVTPQFRKWNGKGSLVSFVISLNLRRRHLTLSQAAAAAEDARPLYAAEARERMLAGKKLDPTANLQEGTGEATEKVAKVFGVSPRSAADAKKVKENSPDLFAAVKRGTVAVSDAARYHHGAEGGSKC